MKEITEQQILALAPNPAAAANGKKISQKGGFVKLERSADDTLYMGECAGSGKSNYITSADRRGKSCLSMLLSEQAVSLQA